MKQRAIIILVLLICDICFGGDSSIPKFSRDVLPILSDNCFHCHGPDAATRKAGLRLDTFEDATKDLGGYSAIVAGRPEKSLLMERILSKDSDEVMPPPKSTKLLKPEQVEILRRWIADGAKFEKHWSLMPPRRPEVPVSAGAWRSWVRNPIDAFVAKRLAIENLEPSAEAPIHTLVRRASLDLTGLPPSPAEVTELKHAYADDKLRETAWAAFVESLLKSPHYGERMAYFWLDAARYSDTDGFQADETRTNWPWRDWVVAAFNSNMSYDRFTLEQFAGDLLPNATESQVLATTFHRNHMTNGEGGRDSEESRIDYVIDRINTVGTVWMGLTLGCCQCHSHKFDPISQAEFYQLNAFFNSIDEDGKAGKNAKPYLAVESPYGRRSVEAAQQWLNSRKADEAKARAEAQAHFHSWLADQLHRVKKDFRAWQAFIPETLESAEGTKFTREADGTIQTHGPNPEQDDYRMMGGVKSTRITAVKLEVLSHSTHTAGGLSRSKTGYFVLTDVKIQVRPKTGTQIRELNVANASADVSADPKKHGGYGDIKHTLDDDPRNGWATFGTDPKEPHVALFTLAEPETINADEELIVELRHRALNGQQNIGRFRIFVTDQAGPAARKLDGMAPLEQLAQLQPIEGGKIPAALRSGLFEQFLADHSPFIPYRIAVERAQSQLDEMKKAAEKQNVMVLAEREKPRETHVLLRGEWDKKGPKVERGVPSALGPWPASEPLTRAGLARWLTQSQHPLTARVTVNHLWQLLFGDGLVRTPEDFGAQGEQPEYPELLDWLAVELVENNWDLHHVLKLIACSATYRQSSSVSEALLQRDPYNRLLARGARYRLPSWMIRDAALESSGLLNSAIGGPPMRPYQPTGVWEDITMGRFKYRATEGADQHRRSLYAFWRRSSAPTFLFDSAQRRVCEVKTARTNTPLQALTLLNDTTYVEAARVLAEKAFAEGTDFPSRLRAIYQRVLSRAPQDAELSLLKKTHEMALEHYRKNVQDARSFLAVGQTPVSTHLPGDELAALTVTAAQVLNLDEAISRE